MLSSSLSLRRFFARLGGSKTRIGEVLRFKSSSPIPRRTPSSPPSSRISSLKPVSSTPRTPPSRPSKTTSTPSSTSLPPTQRPYLRPLQSNPSSKKAFPPRNPRPLPKRTPARARVTTSSLLSVLRDRNGNPSSPPADLASLVPGKGSLEVTGTKGEVEKLARRLMEGTSSLEGGVEVAGWVLRVTEEGQLDEGVKDLVYAVINALLFHLGSFQPRPHPDLLLQFLLANQGRLRLTFDAHQDPLIKLLEIYVRLYTQDRRRLDPSAAAPPPNALAELESLRLQHLVAVRAIHQAMKQLEVNVFTVRSYTSLMNAYNHGRSFEDVQGIWELMRSGGGVGIDHRAVSAYFDSCGFSGSLPRALAAWKDLRATGLKLNENNYFAYQECLTRCGAWDELLVDLGEQQAQHLLDSSTTPPLTAPGLAAMLKLANQIVMHPRHQSLRKVNWDEFNDLRAKMKRLVPRETWEEVERILNTKGRVSIPTSPKTGNGRRPDRERPQ